MKQISISLRDFALPFPPRGSIEAFSGQGRAAAEGREIHLAVQRQRSKAGPLYQAEVSISGSFQRDGYLFRVDGRMDGLFPGDPPLIEEIKSTFNLPETARLLARDPLEHPYTLQLLCYGHFYRMAHQVEPRLSLHLVSTRSGRSLDLPLSCDPQPFQQWLERRLDGLVLEARQAEKRASRRRRVAAGLAFPFVEPRPGQGELMQTIQQGLTEGKQLLIQAPTGLGKTVGVLYPVVKEALGRGQQVVYVTPRNSLHGVAEDALARFQATGARLKVLTVTAKGKICFQDEPCCDPQLCQYARDYHTKLHQGGVLDLLARKRSLGRRQFRDLGRHHELCPFELQLDSAPQADVIICDYNYVFAPRSALGRVKSLTVDQDGRASLVIDEAHNLPQRTMEYYSPSLSARTLEGLRPGLDQIPPRFRHEAVQLLEGCIRAINACGQGGTRPMAIPPPLGSFLEQAGWLKAFLSRYLEAETELQRQDGVLALCFAWFGFCEILEYLGDPSHPEFFTTFHPHPAGGTVRITCCDASPMLKSCYADYQQVVAFSATLKPFQYYLQLCGLDTDKATVAEFPSPFPRDKRKLLIIPQVSTRYGQRERHYARIADAIQRLVPLCRGNYVVFLPSFQFLERVAALFRAPDGYQVLCQERGMGAVSLASILEQLAAGCIPTVLFAVQGGSLSEGVDYAGEMVIGAFVVGPPLPSYDLERELMRRYYQDHYGAGYDYAYVIPAMARAVQAAGRVIRSEKDRGLIVLMDSRFMEESYSRCMPADWFQQDVRELVSGSILGDVAAFWARQPSEQNEEAVPMPAHSRYT